MHSAPPSRYAASTELSADSVEAHPCLPYVFAVSTYQVDKDESERDAASPAYSRRGRCTLHHYDGDRAHTLDTLHGAAILDAKWALASDAPTAMGYGVLGLADATGHVRLYKLRDTKRFAPLAAWPMNSDAALCLSLDVSDRTQPDASDARVLVSQSNGTLAMVPSMHTPQPEGLETWEAHGYEAWIAAWDAHSGDDLALRGWDMRTPIEGGVRQPIMVCQKGFDGGVTSLQSHPTRQHYWAVGSYDETIRIFDARQPRRPVADAPVGGGIWRTKWHPTDPDALLLGCMHGGAHIVRWRPDSSIEDVCHFTAHESIVYGADWERGAWRAAQPPAASLVYSCSFYDAALHIWAGS